MPYIINKNNKPNIDNHYAISINERYENNDLGGVYTHYDKSLGYNVPTENKLKGDD